MGTNVVSRRKTSRHGTTHHINVSSCHGNGGVGRGGATRSTVHRTLHLDESLSEQESAKVKVRHTIWIPWPSLIQRRALAKGMCAKDTVFAFITKQRGTAVFHKATISIMQLNE